jgi:predicted ATPase/DNA-binding winged helix-turn-helix (wHTH) protein
MRYAHRGWTVDLTRRELRADGKVTPIGGRAFELLEILVRANGEVVTKSELLDRVWPGAIVSENALEVHVSALRRALGADRAMLKTVFGRGYCLTGEWRPTQPHAVSAGTAAVVGRESNLPLRVSQLIGRDAEISFIRDRLREVRMITITGPGGIGKTRLGLEVARSLVPEFAGDVQYVELASVWDQKVIYATVAGALDLKIEAREMSPRAVARAIGRRRILLLLDNCEHVVGVAAALAEAIIRTCPQASILATSRELLRIEGEETYRVPPLAVPPDGADAGEMLQHSAVQLFMARMSLQGSDVVRSDLSSVASICRHLDGIPLAIEFAAARAATLDLRSVLAGLAARFDLLTGGRRTALPQHQTLRAALDWSYDLLSPGEKELFRTLGVFRSGFSLEAAVAVAGGARNPSAVMEGIANLVEKSLLGFDGPARSNRWRFLETTRAYAFEKLTESEQAGPTARRHAEFFRELIVPTSGIQLTSEQVARFGREIDNVRAAVDWAFSPEGDAATGIVLTAAYVPVWFNLMLMVECTDRVERALEMLKPELNISVGLRAQLYVTLGFALLNTDGMAKRSGEVLSEGLRLAVSYDDAQLQLRAMWGIWSVNFNAGRYEEAKAAAEKVLLLAERTDDPVNLLVGHRIMGGALHFLGEQPKARFHLAQMLDAPRRESRSNAMWFLLEEQVLAKALQARVLLLQGFIDQARGMAESSLDEATVVGDRLAICYALRNSVCPLAIATGDVTRAQSSVGILLDIVRNYRTTFWMSWAMCLEGQLLVLQGAFADGCKLLRAGLETRARAGWMMRNPEFFGTLAAGLAAQGRPADALAVIEEALVQSERGAQRWWVPELLRLQAEVLLQVRRDDSALGAAERQLRAAVDTALQQGALFLELRAAVSLHRMLLGLRREAEGRQRLAAVYARFTEGFAAADLRAAQAFLDPPSALAR